jgi:hypothetical protein
MLIELTCFLLDRKLAEADVDQDGIPAQITVDTQRIETIRETLEGQSGRSECIVSFSSGDSYVVKKPYKDMIKLWIGAREDDKLHNFINGS